MAMIKIRSRRSTISSSNTGTISRTKCSLLKIAGVMPVVVLAMLLAVAVTVIQVRLHHDVRTSVSTTTITAIPNERSVYALGLPHEEVRPLLRKESSHKSSTTSSNKLAIDLTEIHPVDCHAVPFAFHPGMFVNTRTAIGPSFAMNVHSPKKDTFVSRALANDGCFECDILEATMHALDEASSAKNAVLIDIGSNIGVYSLTAASRGHAAFAFEPFRINWERICRSVLHNNLFKDKVTLFSKAATNQSTVLRFDTSLAKGNRGGIQVKAAHSVITDSNNGDETGGDLMEGRDYVRGVALDQMMDLLPTDQPIVLKVDVEGHECLVLAGAMNYLSRVPQIVYVAIEWSLERLHTSCDNRQAIFDLFAANGLRPYMRVGGNEWKLLDSKQWETWKQPDGGHQPIVGLYDVA